MYTITLKNQALEKGPKGDVGPQGAIGPTGLPGPVSPKSVAIIDPIGNENITIMHVVNSLNVASVKSVIRGTSAPSISYSLYYGSDRGASGTLIVNNAIVSNTSTGNSALILNNTIPANSWVWVEFNNKVGNVDEINISITFE